MPAGRSSRARKHHDIHHAAAQWNYGLYFTWWDRLIGTEHPDYQARFARATRRGRR
jgi:sterol desaturase/sphingolipid hydroxylase (fatty acid hydroxylase superfamily)